MKRMISMLIVLLFSGVAFADVYSFDYVSANDVDNMVINNQSFSDLRVRFCAGTRCAVVTVPTGKTVKVALDIEFEEDYNTMLIPVKFECRDSFGDSIPVLWTMDNARHDINVTLLPDEGWNF